MVHINTGQLDASRVRIRCIGDLRGTLGEDNSILDVGVIALSTFPDMSNQYQSVGLMFLVGNIGKGLEFWNASQEWTELNWETSRTVLRRTIDYVGLV